MAGQAPLHQVPGAADEFHRDEIGNRRPDIGLKVETARKRPVCLAHDVVDGDDGGNCGTLEQQDDLVAIGAQGHDQRLRQDDLEEGHATGKPEREGALPLALRHGLDGAAQDLGLIGGGVEREGQEHAVPGVTEEPPQADRVQGAAEGAKAVIDQEDLRQQRGAAEEIDIGIAERPDG